MTRNKKVRSTNSKNQLRLGRGILQNFSKGSEHVEKSFWPDEFFEDLGVICPKCGCKQVFNTGGGSFGGSKLNTYVCKDCRTEFDIYE
jgi:DNA-directed RNA polymerase subunit RPC12/RpoP